MAAVDPRSGDLAEIGGAGPQSFVRERIAERPPGPSLISFPEGP